MIDKFNRMLEIAQELQQAIVAFEVIKTCSGTGFPIRSISSATVLSRMLRAVAGRWDPPALQLRRQLFLNKSRARSQDDLVRCSGSNDSQSATLFAPSL